MMGNINWGGLTGKKKRILLSILMCACFGSTAYADDTYTYNYDDYTDKITVVDKTYTYTYANGETYEITYKTVEVNDPASGSITYTVSDDTKYDIGVSYVNGEYTGPDGIDINDIRGSFVGIGEVVSGSSEYGGSIYNSGSSSIIGNITAGFINDGDSAGSVNSENGGAIYNGGGATIESITGSYFIGDTIGSETGSSSQVHGGTIYNRSGTSNGGTIGTIEGNYFIGNSVNSTRYAEGGAIYNGGSIDAITGNYFIGNSSNASSFYADGGAIYNESGTIGTIEGNYFIENSANGSAAEGDAIYNYDGTISTVTGNYFISNSANANSSYAAGGAIYNWGNMDTIEGNYFLGNSANAADSYAAGGAVYNYESTIKSVTGNYFVENSVNSGSFYASGGAIYNFYVSTMDTIEDNYFIRNNATSEADSAYGGAIDNDEGTIGSITDNYFVENSTNGITAYGGAIYNNSSIETIEGNYFIGNSATGTSGEAYGGAIYNEGTITNEISISSLIGNYAEGTVAAGGGVYDTRNSAKLIIGGDVIGNYAEAASGDATGGAVYFMGSNSELEINGNVAGNYAKSTGGDAMGGAVMTMGNLTVMGSIRDNYAEGNEALGGAIFAGGDVNIIADGTDIVISGNYTDSAGEKDDNAIYMGGDNATLFFSISDGGSVTLSDNIRGADDYSVSITGDGADTSTFYLLNDIYDANLTAGNVTINTINNEIHTYAVKSFGLTGNVNFVADVDLANETMDTITAESYGTHAGNLNVSGVNLLSDTEKDNVAIAFAEDGLKDYVTSSVGTVPDSTSQQKAYTPLYQYNVAYDNRSDGGYFTFDKVANNPSADVPEEGEAAAISFMNLMYRYAFEHSDYYMKLPKKVRQAIRDGEGKDAEKDFRNYNGHNLTESGIWVKPFASNETIPFKNQFTARTRNYGLLVGMDTAFKEKGNWANVLTGYVGYDGIHQSFEGNSVKQHGGVMGVTDTVYKGNFYAALTLSGGENVLKAHTMYGSEKTHLYMYGVAAKTGYNMEFAGGKYSFLPTFMASYTYADVRDYTSASGLRMDADGMHAVELNPNFKFIRNFNNGWQPYLTVGEIWTVGQNSNIKAGGTKLDELTFKPYTEYGLGLQKMWSKGYDGYAEFLGHAGGRRGFLVNLGFRWAFN